MFKLNLKAIAVIFVVIYIITEYLSYNFYKNLIVKDAKRETISILDTVNAVRDYVENSQKPVIYKLKGEHKLYHDFFDPRILSSSYITRNIFEKYAKIKIKKGDIPYKYKLAATNPLNPKNRADSFESKILEQFRKGEIKEFSTIINENNQSYFFTAIPIERNRASCLICHGDPKNAPKELTSIYGTKSGFHEKLGTLRAIISLKVPVSSVVKSHIKDFIIGSVIVFIVFLIIYLFIYLIYKKESELRKEKLEKENLLKKINLELEKRVKKEVVLNLKKQEEVYERERLLSHQNRLAAMGEMIGNIAHQWRQPLTHIGSLLIEMELFYAKGKLDKELMSKKIEEVDEQISFMSNTIDDFRNFFATGKSMQRYRISTVLNRVERLMGAMLKNKGIELQVEIEDDFELNGFPNEVAQAVLNIISNAKDVLLERGVKEPYIKVKTFIDGSDRVITIEDNAGGINVKPVEKIFEPYFSTKHASIGTGVGLYMTKTIIEKNNNGIISVKNTQNGAVFSIIF